MNILRGIQERVGMALLRRSWSPTDDRWYGWPGVSSSAGIDVNEYSAMRYPALFACVRVIAETMASLPLDVYERRDTVKRKAYDSPLYELLHYQPNEHMSSAVWREMTVAQAILKGDSYSRIEFHGSRPVAIWPLNYADVTPMILDNGRLVYYYKKNQAGEEILPDSSVFHIGGLLSRNGYTSYSVIDIARNAVGLGLVAEKFGSSWFKNGSRSAIALEHPGKMQDGPLLALQESFVKNHTGDNAMKPIILREGMKLSTYSVSPNDAQFLETRELQFEEMARICRIPQHMVGILKHATFTNIEHQGIEFVVHTLTPWFVKFEQEISSKLVADRNRYAVKFNVNGLLRGDAQARANYLEVMHRNGFININEGREIEDWNPILDEKGKPDPAGNKYMLQNIWTPIDTDSAAMFSRPVSPASVAKPEPAPVEKKSGAEYERRAAGAADRNRIRAQYKPLFDDAARRIVNIEVNDIRNAIDSKLKKRGKADFKKWVEKFYSQFPEKFMRALIPILQSYGAAISESATKQVNGPPVSDDDISNFAKGYAEVSALRHSGASLGQINQIIDELSEGDAEELMLALQGRLDEWDVSKADKIAGREYIEAADAFAKAAWVGAGVVSFVWMAQGSDPCPYCEALDGNIVGREGVFAEAGSELAPEGAEPMQVNWSAAHAPLHLGCVCTIGPA